MIAWLDLETTGLDPKVGSILELAFVLTDDDLTELNRFSWLVRPLYLRGLEVMDDYVRKMHAKSGLMKEIFGAAEPRGTPTCSPSAISPGLVEQATIEWLSIVHTRTEDGKVLTKEAIRKTPLGGNSVHFDRAWIKEHMPDLEALFSHRNIDCSTLNELAKRWAPGLHAERPGAAGDPAHRAMADVEGSIKLARYYQDTLFSNDNPAVIKSYASRPEASSR